MVTNQVRSQSRDETSQYSFQGKTVNRSIFFCFVAFISVLLPQSHIFSVTAKVKDGLQEHTRTYDSHLVAALGINWAHAVTIRLVLEAKSGTASQVKHL